MLGALIESLLLRHLYGAPELLQLLATFGVVLILKDVVLATWGPEDLLGPRAAGLRGAIDIVGGALPTYDIFLIFVGPCVLLALWWLIAHTRFGVLVRAASENRVDGRGAGCQRAPAVHCGFRPRRGTRRSRRRPAAAA